MSTDLGYHSSNFPFSINPCVWDNTRTCDPPTCKEKCVRKDKSIENIDEKNTK